NTAGSWVKVAEARDGLLRLDAWLSGDGFLVVVDNDYPGWRTTVDGRPTRVVRANLISRALFVPAGRHHVEMRYLPTSFLLGFYLTLVAVMALSCAGAAALTLWRGTTPRVARHAREEELQALGGPALREENHDLP
ncbi:MAG: hypothetical protein QHJ73_03395, partial [Armatimonadota bacterium]|nr:hypothetical protein [Armatimonadota bacterium]